MALDFNLLGSHLSASAAQSHIHWLSQTTSTNTQLIEAARSKENIHQRVLVTNNQTAGRGRHGKSWDIAQTEALCFSLGWQWQGERQHLSGLSLAVGLWLREALNGLGCNVVLKWPNDLLVMSEHDTITLDKASAKPYAKCGGILIESLQLDKQSTQLVIGVGLNLRRKANSLPAEPKVVADNLPVLHSLPIGCLEPSKTLSPSETAAIKTEVYLAACLNALTKGLEKYQGLASYQTAWQQADIFYGQTVKVLEQNTIKIYGKHMGIDASGRLIIASLESRGETTVVSSGDVSLRMM